MASPKLGGERESARVMLENSPPRAPRSWRTRGSPEDFAEFLAGQDLGLTLIRPARPGGKTARQFPNWLRQRAEAVIWTLKNQLGLERHGARVPVGLWARIVQQILALNAAIWHNWNIVPVKRSRIAYDHVYPARISRLTI